MPIHKCEGSQDVNGDTLCVGEAKPYICHDGVSVYRAHLCDECVDYTVSYGTRVEPLNHMIFSDAGSLNHPDSMIIGESDMGAHRGYNVLAVFHPQCFNPDGTFRREVWTELANVVMLSRPQ